MAISVTSDPPVLPATPWSAAHLHHPPSARAATGALRIMSLPSLIPRFPTCVVPLPHHDSPTLLPGPAPPGTRAVHQSRWTRQPAFPMTPCASYPGKKQRTPQVSTPSCESTYAATPPPNRALCVLEGLFLPSSRSITILNCIVHLHASTRTSGAHPCPTPR